MKTFDTYESIVEFGILKERQANRFYRAMAERVADERISAVFRTLAAEELEHKAKLELELMKVGRTVDTSPDDEEIDPSEYIHSDGGELDMDYRMSIWRRGRRIRSRGRHVWRWRKRRFGIRCVLRWSATEWRSASRVID